MHWAAKQIGRDWRPDWNCWDFAREVFRERLGIDLPEEAHGVLILAGAAHSTGLRPFTGLGQEDDLVLMKTMNGRKHVGVMALANGRIGVLHNDGYMSAAGPVGCVGFSTLRDLTEAGCSEFVFWRRP